MRTIKKECNQCNALVINGLFCHESGCSNERKTFEDGEWITYVKCFECGYPVKENEYCECQFENE